MLIFFVATFVITWGWWLLASTTTDSGARAVLFLLGTFAPGYVAIALTLRAGGRAGAVALVRRLVAWEVAARWYGFALTYVLAVKLLVAVVHRAVWGAWPRFGEVPWYVMITAAIGSTLVGGQAGEELGWRGYALPRLTARWGLGGASVLLGAIWAVWHLPLFFVAEASTAGQSFPLYLLQVTALSVALAWLLARTQGSLLPVMLLHAAVNNTKDIVPSAEPPGSSPWHLSRSPVAWLTVALLWVCAGYFLAQIHRRPQLSLEVAGLAGNERGRSPRLIRSDGPT